MQKPFYAVCLLALCILWGCSSDESDDSPVFVSAAVEETSSLGDSFMDGQGGTPVLLALGGFWSCGQDEELKPTPLNGNGGGPMLPIFVALRLALDQFGIASRGELISCYSVDPTDIHFVTNMSSSQDVVTTAPDDMIKQVEDMLRGLPNPQLFIIGHSYGGWTAMELARRLVGSFAVRHLVTLDPISKVLCTPDTFLTYASQYKTGAPECTTAPRDFTPDQIIRIADGVDRWTNYYETASMYLHADAIVDSDKIENVDMQYTHAKDTLGGHLAFLIDEDLVAELTEILVDLWRDFGSGASVQDQRRAKYSTVNITTEIISKMNNSVPYFFPTPGTVP